MELPASGNSLPRQLECNLDAASVDYGTKSTHSQGAHSLRTFGKARRVPVSAFVDQESEEASLSSPPAEVEAWIPIAKTPAARQSAEERIPAVRFAPSTLQRAAPYHPPAAPSPCTPVTSVMYHTHTVAPGTVEPLSAHPRTYKVKKDWVDDLPLGNNPWTSGGLFGATSFVRQQMALRTWLNSKLETSLSDSNTMSHRRLRAKVRGVLWRQYSGDADLKDVMLAVESRIDSGQLKVQAEESALKCMDGHSQLVAALSAYHPFWLRLGAEVVVGKSVNGSDSGGKAHKAAPFKSSSTDLDLFINRHFLRDPALAKHYSGPTKEVIYWKELGKLVLKRLLLLVILLDKCSQLPNLPIGTPLLIKRGSHLRSSADILQLAVGPLMNEVEVARRLGRIGYKVQYVQQARDEIDYTTKNLAVDLRDGLRLCRLSEALNGRQGLPVGTRYPAQRRPDRLHNVNLALDTFKIGKEPTKKKDNRNSQGSASNEVAEIVDGDREGTLRLLWTLVLQFELPLLADPAVLRMEVDLLWGGSGIAAPDDAPVAAGKGGVEGFCALQLLRWTHAVAMQYDLEVTDFGTSFSDGTVICALIHHYLGDSFLPRQRWGPVPSVDDDLQAYGIAVERNFTAMAKAVEALGGVPPVVNALEFLQPEGPDERAVILFLALLCRRLLDVSKEQRAATVIQRAWRRRQGQRPGTGLDNLRRWVAAAQVVQRCTRAWLCRFNIERSKEVRSAMVSRIAKLQACWRARQAREAFLESKAAAIKIQAVYRGRLTRQYVFSTFVAPRILEAGLRQRQLLVNSRHDRRLVEATVRMQALRRGVVQRHTFLQQKQAAITIQSAVRMHAARSDFLAVKSAVGTLQRHWRGYMVRKELAGQHAAAACIQAAWRHHRADIAYHAHKNGAATTIQAAWRGHVERNAFVMQRQAVITIQAAYRGHVVRSALVQQTTSAIIVQKHVRGFLARRYAQQRRDAAATINHHAAAFIQRRHRQAVLQMKQQMADLAATMQQYTLRTAAATRIQASYRGHIDRKVYHALLAEKQARLRAQQEREDAARAVLSSWAPTVKARWWFVRARKAAAVIQQHWRSHIATQTAAATTIQASVRRWLVQREVQHAQQAALVLQANWRGHWVRVTHPHRSKLAVHRAQLYAAWKEAQRCPNITLGSRTAAALQSLLNSPRSPSIKALEDLAHCTTLCCQCSAMAIESGVLQVLLGVMRGAGRDKSQLIAVRWSLTALTALCHSPQCAEEVYQSMTAKGDLITVTDVLQKNRDNEDVFMAAAGFLGRLLADKRRGTVLGRDVGVVTRLEGVGRMLAHKHSAAAGYLDKLEGMKGSDVSARQATKTLVGVSSQLVALAQVLSAIGAADAAQAAASAGEPVVNGFRGKNTIVRNVLQELKTNTIQPVAH